MKVNRLQRLSEQLSSVILTSTKEPNGTHKIKFKDTILFNGIPDEDLNDYIMAETQACFAKIGKKVKEYIDLTQSRTAQLKLELFKPGEIVFMEEGTSTISEMREEEITPFPTVKLPKESSDRMESLRKEFDDNLTNLPGQIKALAGMMEEITNVQ